MERPASGPASTACDAVPSPRRRRHSTACGTLPSESLIPTSWQDIYDGPHAAALAASPAARELLLEQQDVQALQLGDHLLGVVMK
jgi:hypothetical protein